MDDTCISLIHAHHRLMLHYGSIAHRFVAMGLQHRIVVCVCACAKSRLDWFRNLDTGADSPKTWKRVAKIHRFKGQVSKQTEIPFGTRFHDVAMHHLLRTDHMAAVPLSRIQVI